MIRIIDFDPQHLLWVMDVNASVMKEQMGINLMDLARRSQKKGPCLTLTDNGIAIACGGLSMMFEHSAEIWLRLSKRAGPHAAREIKAQMYRWIEQLSLVRLQATGPTTWTSLPRWWEWLGMHKEAILEKYGPHGEDYFMYAWVKP